MRGEKTQIFCTFIDSDWKPFDLGSITSNYPWVCHCTTLGQSCNQPVQWDLMAINLLATRWQMLPDFWEGTMSRYPRIGISCCQQKSKYFSFKRIRDRAKVIHTKYSKHWPYTTVAHTIDCVCSKMVNHGLNYGLFLSLFKLIPCPIHWIVYVLANLDFIFEF